jgi:hypothetical protein
MEPVAPLGDLPIVVHDIPHVPDVSEVPVIDVPALNLSVNLSHF